MPANTKPPINETMDRGQLARLSSRASHAMPTEFAAIPGPLVLRGLAGLAARDACSTGHPAELRNPRPHARQDRLAA